MRRITPVLLLTLIFALVFAPLAYAAATASGSRDAKSGDRSPGAPFATAISTVTGIAISPLLGTAAYGAFKWVGAKDEAQRAALPWFAQMKFWLPALLVVGVCAAKDSLGVALPPGLKKPLDVLEVMENKFSGLIAAGAVVPYAMETMGKLLLADHSPTAALPSFAASGLATVDLAAMDLSWLLNLLTIPFAIAVFAVVWLASHAINVLILLSPWGAIDAALKGTRTALLGLIAITAMVNPWVGALLSGIVIVIAFFVAGWAYRLMIFGLLFSWEFITGRRHRFRVAADNNPLFAGANFQGVPVRTYGRLRRNAAGGLEFAFRPWLVRPERVVALPAEVGSLAVGRGWFFSDVVAADGRTLFTLPPRYRGWEDELARTYAFGGGVRPAGFRKAWSTLREMLGGRALAAQPAT
jgi:hypothetical protein